MIIGEYTTAGTRRMCIPFVWESSVTSWWLILKISEQTENLFFKNNDDNTLQSSIQGSIFFQVKSSQFYLNSHRILINTNQCLENKNKRLWRKRKFSILGLLCKVWDSEIARKTNQVGDPKQE